MFMRNNRALNGAPQPEATEQADAAKQRASQRLSPNEWEGLIGEDWRFTPKMETCAAINENHYHSGLVDAGAYHISYETDIPFVGTEPPSTPDRKLKGR